MKNQMDIVSTAAKIVLISILIILYSSCHYDNVQQIAPVIPKAPWALDSSLWGENKYQLNSIAINDSLLLVANAFVIWNVIPSRMNKSIEGNFISILQATSDLYPPSLNKDISVSWLNKDRLAIYPTLCAACSNNIIIFNPPYSSSSASLKELMKQVYFTGGNKGGYPVIESKYILAPFEFDYNTNTGSLALIKIDTSHNFAGSKYGPNLQLNSVKVISIQGNATEAYFSAKYYDKFFMLVYGHGYRIDTLGNAKLLPIYPQQMFTLSNRLFALSINSQLFVSDDQGENWSLFATLQSPFADLQYYNVGKDLYASFEAQLWKVNMIGNQIVFTELENHGLETNLITSINKCGKYAFVTTTSGLYYKDTAAFNTSKAK